VRILERFEQGLKVAILLDLFAKRSTPGGESVEGCKERGVYLVTISVFGLS